MRVTQRTIAAVLALLALAMSTSVGFAIEEPQEKKVIQLEKLQQIFDNPKLYLNETVEIDGFVDQYLEPRTPVRTSRFYLFKDDWKGSIRVRTSGQPPEVGRRYKIIAAVTLDEDASGRAIYFLVEEQRVGLDSRQSQ